MTDNAPTLRKSVSPIGAFSLALGTSIGWGSLVVTCNEYLAVAGPWGSVIGILIGSLIMLVIAWNYHYMVNCFPEAGGVYAYTREAFGYDHAFVAAWFLSLSYLSIYWANVTSLPLFARYFFGEHNPFAFVKLYTIFSYDVYLGEVLLCGAAVTLFGLLCMRSSKVLMRAMALLAGVFILGIAGCTIGALIHRGGAHFEPGFHPDTSVLRQIVHIACISPWAFIGFENISHGVEEYSFRRKKVFHILAVAVLTAAALYILALLLSVSAYPPEYHSWVDYIRDLNNISPNAENYKGLPAFYAVSVYLGPNGVLALMLALLALIISSLIGNVYALSRLLYAMGRDQVVPEGLDKLNRAGAPSRAVLLIMCLSLLIPFLGRMAIGWIVDVTTISATLLYGLVALAVIRIARKREDTRELWTGRIGLTLMVLFGAYLLLPNFFTQGTMATETYLLFVAWCVLGFLVFRLILKGDKQKRFGKTIVAWVALLLMVLMVALIWMNQSMLRASSETRTVIHAHYQQREADEIGAADEEFIDRQIDRLSRTNTQTMIVTAGMFAFALAVMFTNFSYISKKVQESELALSRANNLMNTDPLTGVKSKHAYAELEQSLNEQIKAGSAGAFALAVCDVNGLKYVNDSYGHKAGDEYLKSGSRLICETFQHSPVYRTGGDEFVVLLRGHDLEERDALLDQLNRQVEENIPQEKAVISVGVAVYDPVHDHSLHQVFEYADTAMYVRKQQLKAMGAHVRN